MTMAVIVMVPICTMLRIERRLDRGELRAETTQHILQHMVTANAQLAADHLHIGVAIADVPGEPGEIMRARRRDLDQRFGLAGNPHDCSILQHEPVAVPQRGGMRQVEQECGATLARQRDPPAMALIGVEDDTVDNQSVVNRDGAANR